jgi:hypothetical protein
MLVPSHGDFSAFTLNAKKPLVRTGGKGSENYPVGNRFKGVTRTKNLFPPSLRSLFLRVPSMLRASN